MSTGGPVPTTAAGVSPASNRDRRVLGELHLRVIGAGPLTLLSDDVDEAGQGRDGDRERDEDEHGAANDHGQDDGSRRGAVARAFTAR